LRTLFQNVATTTLPKDAASFGSVNEQSGSGVGSRMGSGVGEVVGTGIGVRSGVGLVLVVASGVGFEAGIGDPFPTLLLLLLVMS
jgi:hypothetical protein